MSNRRELRHARKEAIERLKALGDEARLRLHLLSMGARQRWGELEQEIVKLEERAARDGEDAVEALTTSAKELGRSLSDLLVSEVDHAAGVQASVRSLMTTHVRTCRSDDSLAHAAQLMWDTNCGAIPVVSGDEVVGVITDRDICMATYTQGRAPGELRVDGAMSKQLFSCSPDDSIGVALALMGSKRVRRLPVLNDRQELVGIISMSDVARCTRSRTNPNVDAALTDALGQLSLLSPEKMPTAAH